jgi:hypothetical protein
MPDWAREVRTRLSSLQLSPTREREIIEELTQHLDDRWCELMAGGASPDEASGSTGHSCAPKDRPGFLRPAEVQTFSIQVPAALIRDRQQVARTHEQIAERLMHVPGVTAAGLSSSIGMDGATGTNPVFVEDRPGSGTPPARRSKGARQAHRRNAGRVV